MRVLVDTNILIDFFAHRDPHYQLARKLLLLGALGEFEIWMSASQMTDVFYLLTSGPNKLDPEEAKQSLRRLRQVVHVCALGEEEVDAALDSTWKDFEDACILQAALKTRSKAIITRNQKDFDKSPIRVFDCGQLFAYLESEKGLAYDEIDF